MRQLEVHLKPWEARQLRQLRDHVVSVRMLKRAVCLLMSAAGEHAATIAGVTGLSIDAVTDVRRRWRQRRLRSLADRPRPGRPSLITSQYRRELRRALGKGPLACGFVFTVWSIARLGAFLQRRTGIALAISRLRRLVHQEGFVVGRPKHTLANKRNPREYRRTKHRLNRLKKGRFKRTRPSSFGTPTPPNSIFCRTCRAAGCQGDGNWR